MSMPSKIAVGKTFNNWTAIRFASCDEKKCNQKWWFRCECGTEKIVSKGAVEGNYSKSCGCLRRPTRDESRVNAIFKLLKAGAKRRSYSVLLNKSDIAALVEKQGWRCVRSGMPLDITMGPNVRPFGPSIDRIDNDRGYEVGNIQLVCNLYNYCKNRFTDDDVLAFAKSLVEFSRETEKLCSNFARAA